MTASVSTKRLRIVEAFSVRLSFVSDRRLSTERSIPTSSASDSSFVSSDSSSAEAMVLSMESWNVV